MNVILWTVSLFKSCLLRFTSDFLSLYKCDHFSDLITTIFWITSLSQAMLPYYKEPVFTYPIYDY